MEILPSFDLILKLASMFVVLQALYHRLFLAANYVSKKQFAETIKSSETTFASELNKAIDSQMKVNKELVDGLKKSSEDLLRHESSSDKRLEVFIAEYNGASKLNEVKLSNIENQLKQINHGVDNIRNVRIESLINMVIDERQKK